MDVCGLVISVKAPQRNKIMLKYYSANSLTAVELLVDCSLSATGYLFPGRIKLVSGCG
jgi:hypothetical protein